MILACADRELVAELHDDVAVAERLGMELDGLIEAAEGCTERLFLDMIATMPIDER